jgi:predicted Mrr-cat superfamily restriction endonuclease
MLYRFANEIAGGDWVLVPDAATRSIHAGRVTGAYVHSAREHYPHTRAVAYDQHFERDELPPEIQQQLTSNLTVFRPSAQDELREFLGGA